MAGAKGSSREQARRACDSAVYPQGLVPRKHTAIQSRSCLKKQLQKNKRKKLVDVVDIVTSAGQKFLDSVAVITLEFD